MSRYVYYQPNHKDIKDQYGDCTIRALSKALGVTWLEAYDMQIPHCREWQVSNVFDAPVKIKKQIMSQMGFEYHPISNKKGSKRPTVDGFAKSHKQGRFIVSVANHEVAVVDGKYYDTWDSGYKSLYGYYELVDSPAKPDKPERLTRWNGEKYILPQGRTADGQSYWRIIADRLAEYENREY